MAGLLREAERRASDWIQTASIIAKLKKSSLATGRKLLIDSVFTLRNLWVLTNDVIGGVKVIFREKKIFFESAVTFAPSARF